MPRYPYSRFVYFPPARGFLARAQSAWFSLRHSVSSRFLNLKWRLIGWWNRGKYEPLASFDPQTGRPVLADVPESAHSCRTRHGRATILYGFRKLNMSAPGSFASILPRPLFLPLSTTPDITTAATRVPTKVWG
jgi:hypothetical protein